MSMASLPTLSGAEFAPLFLSFYECCMDLHTCMHAHTAWSVTQFYMKQNVSCNKGFSLDGLALPQAIEWWWMLGWCHQQAPPVLCIQTVLNLSITSSKFVCVYFTHTNTRTHTKFSLDSTWSWWANSLLGH